MQGNIRLPNAMLSACIYFAEHCKEKDLVSMVTETTFYTTAYMNLLRNSGYTEAHPLDRRAEYLVS